jgi:hypothetical protein
MILVQEAVKKAVAFVREVLEANRTDDILLEEVEPDTFAGKEGWIITLSLRDPNMPLPFGANRQYKTFTVDGETGEVRAMKIRQLSSAT